MPPRKAFLVKPDVNPTDFKNVTPWQGILPNDNEWTDKDFASLLRFSAARFQRVCMFLQQTLIDIQAHKLNAVEGDTGLTDRFHAVVEYTLHPEGHYQWQFWGARDKTESPETWDFDVRRGMLALVKREHVRLREKISCKRKLGKMQRYESSEDDDEDNGDGESEEETNESTSTPQKDLKKPAGPYLTVPGRRPTAREAAKLHKMTSLEDSDSEDVRGPMASLKMSGPTYRGRPKTPEGIQRPATGMCSNPTPKRDKNRTRAVNKACADSKADEADEDMMDTKFNNSLIRSPTLLHHDPPEESSEAVRPSSVIFSNPSTPKRKNNESHAARKAVANPKLISPAIDKIYPAVSEPQPSDPPVDLEKPTSVPKRTIDSTEPSSSATAPKLIHHLGEVYNSEGDVIDAEDTESELSELSDDMDEFTSELEETSIATKQTSNAPAPTPKIDHALAVLKKFADKLKDCQISDPSEPEYDSKQLKEGIQPYPYHVTPRKSNPRRAPHILGIGENVYRTRPATDVGENEVEAERLSREMLQSSGEQITKVREEEHAGR